MVLLTSLGKGTKLSFRVAADRVERPPEGGTGAILWDDVFPEAPRCWSAASFAMDPTVPDIPSSNLACNGEIM